MTDSAKQDTAPKAAAEQEDVTAADAHEAEAHEAHEAPAAPAAGDDGKPDLDEVKRKFRAALDRKREIHAEGSGKGGQDSGKIHGAHGPARHDRQFRRKSG
jgi:uncharacterized protein DUF5302